MLATTFKLGGSSLRFILRERQRQRQRQTDILKIFKTKNKTKAKIKTFRKFEHFLVMSRLLLET
jgi:hypothetical protein